MKFASSIVVYLATLAVYLQCLRGHETSKSVIAWTAILTMLGEIVLIIMQTVRGTPSHFNNTSAFNSTVFTIMGSLIVINTLMIIWLTILYFQADLDLPTALAWGMRLGLVVFVIGSVEGGYMATQIGHTVGASDGGRGLPFVNWSVTNGDLRVAHFFGLHAFQIIPLAALLFLYLRDKLALPSPTLLTIAFAIVYFGAFNLLFVQAFLGKPLISETSLVAGKYERNHG
ncbi:MAG: hypothetical protein H7Z37_10625 [Pyrinomonadaceae bacterium]|nr:hypothetical protein [Pyrinomonadaceae bacterium]